MSNKFLSTATVNLSDGSTPILAATLGAANLDSGSAVKVNSQLQLYSTNLETTDINGLTAAIGAALLKDGTNAMTGTLKNIDGANSSPSYTFTTNQGSGMLLVSGGPEVGISVDGVLLMQFALDSSSLGSDLYMSANDINLVNNISCQGLDIGATATGPVALEFKSTGSNSVLGPDNQANSLILGTTGKSMITLDTTTAAEKVLLGYNIDMGNNKIQNLPTPTSAQDAATKAYVDNIDFIYSLSTGLQTGGVLSVGTPNTTFSITDGTGVIMTSDPLGAGTISKADVSWSGKTNIPVTNIATQLITFICIDSGGNVIQLSSRPTAAQRRTTYIFLGVVVHVDKTIVDTVNNQQDYIAYPASQLRDLSTAIGFLNASGNIISKGTGLLEIQKSLGTMYATGANYSTDPFDPNIISLAAVNPITFQYRLQNGTNVVPDTSNIDPSNYDNGGTLTAMTNNYYSVQRVYLFTSGNIKIQPGQVEYKTASEAKDGILTENFVVEPSILANGLHIANIIVQQGETDLSNATFISIGKFGSTTTSAAGDVYGPSTPVTDSSIVLFDGTNGKLIKGTGITVDGSNNIVLPGILDASSTLSLGTATATQVNVGRTGQLTNVLGDLNVDEQLIIADGTQAAPSLRFTSNADAGFFYTTNTINAGVDNIRIMSLARDVTGTPARGSVAIGSSSGINVTGNYNISIGANGGIDLTSCLSNIAIGTNAGNCAFAITGNDNIFIGTESCLSGAGSYTRSIALGYQAMADKSNQFAIGGSGLIEIVPHASASCDLGSTTNEFDNMFLKGVINIDGVQVVQQQGAAVADATDAASAITQLNALLARCRAHGLIAT